MYLAKCTINRESNRYIFGTIRCTKKYYQTQNVVYDNKIVTSKFCIDTFISVAYIDVFLSMFFGAAPV